MSKFKTVAKRFQHAAPALILWSVVAAMAFDMAPVFQSQIKINNAAKTSHHANYFAAVEEEIRAINACRNADSDEAVISGSWRNKQWRDCVLAKSLGIRTYIGTVYFAAAASAWLRNNPKDAEVKFTALENVERARETFLTQYEQIYKINDDMNVVAAQSKVLRLNGFKKPESQFEVMVHALNKAENSIYNPSVTESQEDWAAKQRALLAGEDPKVVSAI